MTRLGFPTKTSTLVIVLVQLVGLTLVAHTCGNPGRCGWACTDDAGCASDYSCVDGMCWNIECDEERVPDMELEVPELCGNGVVDSGEDCDGTDMTQCLDTQVCLNCQCVYSVGCGNGVVDGDEECDGTDMTGCLSTQECIDCQCVYVVEAPSCGNGVVDDGEDCDGDDMTGCLDTQVCHNCQCVYSVGCGNGICDTATENTDLCPEDCPCVNDGTCAEGEGFACLDCGDPTQACGSPCESSETCPSPLSCFNAVCWEACLCEGDCGGEGEGAECWCLGPDIECEDGTLIPGGCLPN